MIGTLKLIAPVAYIANAATNIYTPPASTIITVIRHIRVVNKDTVPRTFSLYVGATGGSAGGTEIAKDVSVAVGSYIDLPFDGLRLASTDFLTGIASAASALTILVTGYQGVV